MTGPAIRKELRLSEHAFAVLVRAKHLVSIGQNACHYPVYPEEQVEKLRMRRHDGSLRKLVAKADMRRDAASTRVGGYLTGDMLHTREQALKAFALLKSGENPVDIAIKLDIHPSAMKVVMREYCELEGGLLIPALFVERINEMRSLPGIFPITSPSELIELLEACVEERTCIKCKRMERSQHCRRCAPEKRQVPLATPAVASAEDEPRPEIRPESGHGAGDGDGGSDFEPAEPEPEAIISDPGALLEAAASAAE